MRKKMEQILLEDGELFTAASGISMLPCIRPQKDILHLVRPEGIVETSEVILYRRKNGSYILHRVIGRDTEGYILCGDHQWIPEHGIHEEQVLGVLRGFYRGEDYVDCRKDRRYRIYVKIWCSSIRARKWIIRLADFVWRGWKGLRGKWNKNR